MESNPTTLDRLTSISMSLPEAERKKFLEMSYETLKNPNITIIRFTTIFITLFFVLYKYYTQKKQLEKKKAIIYAFLSVACMGLIYFLPMLLRINIIYIEFKYWWAIVVALLLVYYFLIRV